MDDSSSAEKIVGIYSLDCGSDEDYLYIKQEPEHSIDDVHIKLEADDSAEEHDILDLRLKCSVVISAPAAVQRMLNEPQASEQVFFTADCGVADAGQEEMTGGVGGVPSGQRKKSRKAAKRRVSSGKMLNESQASEQVFAADSGVADAGQEVTGGVGGVPCGRRKKSRKAAKRRLGSRKRVKPFDRKLCKTKQLHVCDACRQPFESKVELVNHRCSRTPKVRGTRDKPFSRKLSRAEIQHTCSVCHQSFGSKAELTKHKRKHRASSSHYMCELCGKRFTVKCNFDRHKWIHTGEKPFRCDVCDKAFNSSYNLISHKRAVHFGMKLYRCHICDKDFSRSSHLKTHIRIHTGYRPYKCDLCDRTFSDATNFKVHKRTHSGEHPYKCAVCDKAFTQRGHLVSHLEKHSLDGHEDEHAYTCLMCHRACSSRANLDRHMRACCGMKHQCHFCPRSFVRASDLRVHVRTHTNEKPYKCCTCDKAFSRSSGLAIHRRIHTGIKPYVCEFCAKAFSASGELNKHKHRMHGSFL